MSWVREQDPALGLRKLVQPGVGRRDGVLVESLLHLSRMTQAGVHEGLRTP
jgi:hypothetical protein